MPYSTEADILNQISESELIQLSQDHYPDITSIDSVVVSRAIVDADEEIEGYCAKQYTVPITPVPEFLRKLSVDLALYNLYSRRGEDVPEIREKRYKNAVNLLEKISKGTVTLGVTPAPQKNEAQSAAASAKDRVFTRATMSGW